MPSVLRTNAPDDDQQRIADALAGLAAGGEQNQAAADAMVPPPGGHGVAQLTGLPSGGTNAALQGESRAAARDRYLRSAGENAAGADQKRMDMTLNELAAKPWWKSLDYPAEQQLFTYSPMIRRK